MALTLFNYYGGKARFAETIADFLDYRHTDIYIEPFGGAASVLLNKPPHHCEMYSDLSRGLTALMECLSDKTMSKKLIYSLCSDTEYSEECFEECLNYKTYAEICDIRSAYKYIYGNDYKMFFEFLEKVRKLEKILIDNIIKYDKNFLGIDSYDDAEQEHTDKILGNINKLRENPKIFTKDCNNILNDIQNQYNKNAEDYDKFIEVLSKNYDFSPASVDKLELAKSTYVVYSMSRDGMGTVFSSAKYKSNEHYYNGIIKLFDVAERMKYVVVNGYIDVFTYIFRSVYANDLTEEEREKLKNSFLDMDKENVMFYLDPPYLVDDKRTKRKNITFNKNDFSAFKNLGSVYTGQMTENDHKTMLEIVSKSKAKFLISNYDNSLYNSMLKDWNKATIDTFTSVGGKAGNKRVECLWYNY